MGSRPPRQARARLSHHGPSHRRPPSRSLRRAPPPPRPSRMGNRAPRPVQPQRTHQRNLPRHPPRPRLPITARPHRKGNPLPPPRRHRRNRSRTHRILRHAPRLRRLRPPLLPPRLQILRHRQHPKRPTRRLRHPKILRHPHSRKMARPMARILKCQTPPASPHQPKHKTQATKAPAL